MSEKVLGFKEKDVWKSGNKVKGVFYYNVFDNELVLVVSVEKLEKILKEVENKKTSKIVLENGCELESEPMSFEKKEGIHMTVNFIREKLKPVRLQAVKEGGK